jgi:hypothetical protein
MSHENLRRRLALPQIERAVAQEPKAPGHDQQMNINSGQRRWTARLVSTPQPYAQAQGFECDRGLGDDLTGRFIADEMRNRPGSRNAAKRAMFEMIMYARVMVQMMGHLCRETHRTYLQLKWRTARRHKADGHVSSKQQHRQQEAGQ